MLDEGEGISAEVKFDYLPERNCEFRSIKKIAMVGRIKYANGKSINVVKFHGLLYSGAGLDNLRHIHVEAFDSVSADACVLAEWLREDAVFVKWWLGKFKVKQLLYVQYIEVAKAARGQGLAMRTFMELQREIGGVATLVADICRVPTGMVGPAGGSRPEDMAILCSGAEGSSSRQRKERWLFLTSWPTKPWLSDETPFMLTLDGARALKLRSLPEPRFY